MANPAGTHLEQWLRSTSCDDSFSHHDLAPDSGFAAALYQVCLLQLSRLVDSLASLPKPGHKRSFKEVRWRLVVFGDGFEDGKLESCINFDNELRDIVLGILYDIGKILIQGECYIIGLLKFSQLRFQILLLLNYKQVGSISILRKKM
jgi:hypothetical protein